MDKLPVEILEEILGFTDLSKEELFANRLICRRLCALFTPRAFRAIRTNNFSRDSFDHLCSIAQTPYLADCVVEYEYRLVELLNRPNHHEVDKLLPLLATSSGSSWSPGDSPVNLEDFTERLHQQHQIYLHQQDILGTFYDTLSIVQSLPLLPKLRVIRILDFENSDLEGDVYTSCHQTAVARAFYNIVKTLSFTKTSCFLNLESLEFDRFDYEILTPYPTAYLDYACSSDVLFQFNNALLQISCLRINHLTNRRLPEHQHLAPFILANTLMEAGNRLEELYISDGSGVTVPHPEEGFPWSYRDLDYSSFIEAGKGQIFPNLRKLGLSGHRSVSLLSFVGMFMSLTPGVLKELSLESLGMHGGRWDDFFRIVAPKTMWVNTRADWPGEIGHEIIQLRIRTGMRQDNLDEVEDWFELQKQQKGHAEGEPWRNKNSLWKGVALESCRIRHICHIFGIRIHTYTRIAQDEIHISRLQQFEKWMVEGLEEDEYELFPLRTQENRVPITGPTYPAIGYASSSSTS